MTTKKMEPKTITAMVVDDDENIVRLLTDFLEISGVHVLGQAHNGKEAVDFYKNQRADVVILDIMMPKYDGFYALERITKMDPTSKILILTADFRIDSKRLNEMQGVEIIYKPFDFNHIMASIKKLLDSSTNIAAYQGAHYNLR